MTLSNDIKQEIISTVHNTIDFCGNVNQAVQTVIFDNNLTIDINNDLIQEIIFDATLTWGK